MIRHCREANQQKNNSAGDGGKAVQRVNARRVRGKTRHKCRQRAARQHVIHRTDDNANNGQKKSERFHLMFAPVNDVGVVTPSEMVSAPFCGGQHFPTRLKICRWPGDTIKMPFRKLNSNLQRKTWHSASTLRRDNVRSRLQRSTIFG